MKQYKVRVYVKSFNTFEGYEEDRIVTCNELLRDQRRDNVVYADGREIDLGWCKIIEVSIVDKN